MAKKISVKDPHSMAKTAVNRVDSHEGKKRFTLDLPSFIHKNEELYNVS